MEGAAALKKPAGELVAGRKPGAVGRGRGSGRTAGRTAAGRGRGTTTALPPAGGVTKPEGHGARAGQGLGRSLMGRAARQAATSAQAAAGRRQEGAAAGTVSATTDIGAGGANTAGDDSFAGTFAKDLPAMMYGFGDDEVPLQETVEVVEAALLQYIGAVSSQAATVAANCLKPKLDERDVLFVVRKDPAKFARIKNLIHMQQVIADSRKGFETADLTQYQ